MHDSSVSVPFDLTGEFGGFQFTDAGKRRLLLRVGEEIRLLKVPRPLRRRMIGNYRPGQTIRVAGIEERDPAGLLPGKWVVSEVLTPGTPGSARAAAPSGPIRVCAKKNCWRNGGCELYAALEKGIEARGLGGQVRVKAVGCLDRCKQGPNADWGNREFSRSNSADAEAMLTQVAQSVRDSFSIG